MAIDPRHKIEKLPFTYFKPNTVQYWEGGDSEEVFNKHMANPKTRQAIIDHGYIDHPPIYQIDELGFRNPGDINISESVLVLGCSHTFGTGQPREWTWPYLLGEKLNMTIYNAAMGGASSDHNFRIASTLIPKYKPKMVFHLLPNAARFEVINDGYACQITPRTDPSEFNNGLNYYTYLRYRMNDITIALQQERNVLAIKNLCRQQGIPYVHAFASELNFEIPNREFEENTVWARDLQHFGIGHNRETAKQMYQRYINTVVKKHDVAQDVVNVEFQK